MASPRLGLVWKDDPFERLFMCCMEQKGVVVPEVQTADNSFGLIGRRQCSAALGGPATSNSQTKAPMGFKKAWEF